MSIVSHYNPVHSIEIDICQAYSILVHAANNVCSLCVVHCLFGRWLESKNVNLSWLTLEYNFDVNCCVCAVGRVMECSCFSFVGLFNIGDCKCAY